MTLPTLSELNYLFQEKEPGTPPLLLYPTHPISLPPGDSVYWLEAVKNTGQGLGTER